MRNNNSKGNESRKGGGSLLAGILLGMILGLVAAGGVAWYILKNGSASFEDKEHRPVAKPALENGVAIAPAKPIAAPAAVITPAPTAAVSAPAAASAAASAVSQTPQHFEFYKVLTDKTDNAAAKPAPAAKHPPVADTSIYYIQAGSFPNLEDAEKVKAKLSLMGMDVSVLTVDIAGKGTYHRVRVGPFKGSNEANAALATLKQNDIAHATAYKSP